MGRTPCRAVLEDVAAPIGTLSADNDPVPVRAFLGGHGMIDRHDDAPELRQFIPPAFVQRQAVPDGTHGHGLILAKPDVTVSLAVMQRVVGPLRL